MASAYSSTPLARKLGIKEGFVIRLHSEPANYYALFTDWPPGVTVDADERTRKNLVHFFTTTKAELGRELPALKAEIFSNGSIWISWPKKAAKLPTDLTEDV